MDSLSLTEKIDQQEWLEPVAEGLQKAIADAYAAGGATGQKIEDFLHGVWLGHPLHPTLTDVPIGAWTVSTVLDVAEAARGRNSLARGADTAIGIGIVGALFAAAAGMTDWYRLKGRSERRVGLVHGLLNIGATALFTTAWFLRKGRQRRTGRQVAFMGYALAFVSAYLGGSLVYEQKIGVDHAQREPQPEEFVPVLPESELAENSPRVVEVNGIKVMLVRKGEQIFALADTCSHMGGPLSEGEFSNGSVICPWHGSRFALKDGRVLDGPATFPQPCFEARIRNGQIEIRKNSHLSAEVLKETSPAMRKS